MSSSQASSQVCSVRSAIDVEQFIGIPYDSRGRTREGVDCWGLVRLCYERTYAIVLPSYAAEYIDSAEAAETSRVINEHKADWNEVGDPVEGDVVLLRIMGDPVHVGIYLEGRRMLNVRRGTDSCVEQIDTRIWRPRIVGYYRHCLLS